MHFTSLAVTALLSTLSVAQTVDVQVVAVGKNPLTNETGLKYWPEKITAAPGTMVQFQFWAGNHTVTQSSFDNPCLPIGVTNSSAQGVNSGFQPVSAEAGANAPVFTVMVKDSKPMWLYCAKGNHCQSGMVMVINENTGANSTRSLDNYKGLAGTVPAPGGAAPGGGSGNGNGGTGSPTDGAAPSQTPPSAAGRTAVGMGTLLLAFGASLLLL
ncbi:extracellular serine-rich protein [Paramyrothecium foliicola]|nr:extracellular serine-rich protein [Paramyrothecium foliicola]